MTNQIAFDINTIARYLGIRAPHVRDDRPSGDEACAALERLAEKASRHLGAGVRPLDVVEQWRPLVTDFDDEVACASCGCTEDNACDGGCSWVHDDPPVCSACVEGTTLDDVLVRIRIAAAAGA